MARTALIIAHSAPPLLAMVSDWEDSGYPLEGSFVD